MNSIELYGNVFQRELATRFAQPDFAHRVSLFGKVRGMVKARKSPVQLPQTGPDRVNSIF